MRYLRLRSRLAEVGQAYPDLGLVVYERPHQRGRFATGNLLGYSAHVESWCAAESLEHTDCHSGTLKKWATGKGNASKDEMREHGRRRFLKVLNTAVISDDEVDALWLLAWAQDNYRQ